METMGPDHWIDTNYSPDDGGYITQVIAHATAEILHTTGVHTTKLAAKLAACTWISLNKHERVDSNG